MTLTLRYFSEIGSIGGALRKSGWRYSKTLRRKCSPKLPVFSDISLTMIWCRNPSIGGLNATGVAKYSDFGRIEGYISETVQERK